MKLSNSTLIGIGLAMLITGFLVITITGHLNWPLIEQGRRDEVTVWPVIVGYLVSLTGFFLSMDAGIKEFNAPTNPN